MRDRPPLPPPPIFRIIESDRLEAWIGIPTDVVPQLMQQKKHRLLIGDTEYESSSARLIPELNSATRTQTVIFDLDSLPIMTTVNSVQKDDTHIDTQASEPAAPTVVPGQIVRVAIQREHSASGFWVPSAALSRSAKGLWSVLVVEEVNGKSVVARRDIEVLENDGQRSLVRGTLKSQEEVIVAGVHKIVPGQQVRIAD